MIIVARRPGGSQTMENIKHAKEAATVIEASTSQEVEDEVEMVQEMDAVEDIEYDLVEDAEEDSDYKSDFDRRGGFKWHIWQDSKILNRFLQWSVHNKL